MGLSYSNPVSSEARGYFADFCLTDYLGSSRSTRCISATYLIASINDLASGGRQCSAVGALQRNVPHGAPHRVPTAAVDTECQTSSTESRTVRAARNVEPPLAARSTHERGPASRSAFPVPPVRCDRISVSRCGRLRYLMTMTGTVALVSTFCATLPMRAPRMPPWPWLPITIRSHWQRAAALRISSSGKSLVTCKPA